MLPFSTLSGIISHQKSLWSERRQPNKSNGFSRDAVITESMQLAEKVLTLQSCALSYGPLFP